MTGPEVLELTPGQVAVLERVLKAGFKFVTVEHVARNLAVEKNHFVALLDTAGGKVQIFGQVGYLRDKGIAVLVERSEGKAFVWKSETLAASAELLASYEGFKGELKALLGM